MKKLFSLSVMAVTMLFVSCSSSSSFEKDVKKMAEYQCRMQKIMTKGEGDNAEAELEKLEKEMEVYVEEMEKKYKDKQNDKEWEAKAQKILAEEMTKCK